jgi:uncharacterized membrane protein YqjE
MRAALRLRAGVEGALVLAIAALAVSFVLGLAVVGWRVRNSHLG